MCLLAKISDILVTDIVSLYNIKKKLYNQLLFNQEKECRQIQKPV